MSKAPRVYARRAPWITSRRMDWAHVLRGLSAKRQAAHFGTDVVDEFIEEHEPEEERKPNM